MLNGQLKKCVAVGIYGILLGISAVYAENTSEDKTGEAAAEPWAFKLTPSYYVTTNEKDATDTNLRANHGPHAIWVGYYRRGSEFEQTRTGYEYTMHLSFGQLVPSLQLASGGFVGGSINAQIGDSNYALLGFGRTNARDYYNLNFDPNDSYTINGGYRWKSGASASV